MRALGSYNLQARIKHNIFRTWFQSFLSRVPLLTSWLLAATQHCCPMSSCDLSHEIANVLHDDMQHQLFLMQFSNSKPNIYLAGRGGVAPSGTARPAGTGSTGCRQFGSPRKQPSFSITQTPDDSKTRTYHGRVESGRTAGRRGGAGQDGTPTKRFAQETSVPRTLRGIENTSPERLSRRTNKGNPM